MATTVDMRGQRVLVVGAGAIGGYYGSILAAQGARVSVVCRSDAAVVREHGFTIKSADAVRRFRPEAVLEAATEVGEPPDYLVVSVKAVDGLDVAALVRGAVGRHTHLVLMQNGVGVEAPLAEAYPDNELISVVAFVAVSRIAPGVIHHQAYDQLRLGRYPDGVSAGVEALAQAFRAGGVACEVVPDVQRARWHKALWNAAFNPLSVLAAGASTGDILDAEGAEALIRSLMAEVRAVAGAAGFELEEEMISSYIDQTRRMPPYQTSMALDYLNGRPMEVEAILGNVVRAASAAGVAVPRLETVYAAMKVLQRRLQSTRSASADLAPPAK